MTYTIETVAAQIESLAYTRLKNKKYKRCASIYITIYYYFIIDGIETGVNSSVFFNKKPFVSTFDFKKHEVCKLKNKFTFQDKIAFHLTRKSYYNLNIKNYMKIDNY